MRAGERFSVEVDISNDGAVAGEETAFLFIRDPIASVARPVLELKGMAAISLAPGASGAVRFELAAEDLGFPGGHGAFHLEPGLIEIFVGPSANRASLKGCRIHVVKN